MEWDIKIIADEFKNHIEKEHMIDYSKEIITNTILMKKLRFHRKLDTCWIKYYVYAECGTCHIFAISANSFYDSVVVTTCSNIDDKLEKNWMI